MSALLTTRAAAELAQLSVAGFRAAASVAIRNGRQLRVAPELWPDARTPLWNADAIVAWRKSGRRTNSFNQKLTKIGHSA